MKNEHSIQLNGWRIDWKEKLFGRLNFVIYVERKLKWIKNDVYIHYCFCLPFCSAKISSFCTSKERWRKHGNNFCVYTQRESHRKNIRVWESRDPCVMRLLGAWFSSFWVRGVKRRRRRETARKDSWQPQDVEAAELKMQFFSCCTGLNMSSRSSFYFSCLAIQVYRVAAVCFVILTMEEACEGPTQVLRSEGRTKITCCIVVYLSFIKFATSVNKQ